MEPDELTTLTLAWLGQADATTGRDHDALTVVAPAVVEFVGSLPGLTVDAEGDWTGTYPLGAVMLAARLVRRRNSPGGVEPITTDGVAYVSRSDHDIARMLRIDAHKAPQVG